MEEKRVVLSFGSFVLVGLTIGITGGFVYGTFFSIKALINGELLQAVLALPVATVGNGLSVAVSSAVGYLLYKRLVARFYKLGVLSGTYEEPTEPGDIAFSDSSDDSVS
ncbi:hypothetical protein K8B33_07005 [Alcanivorax sp. JB21]|uniref:hypothetical protein n=1 Tax=Alcanivorax limicola TaxID=2874102 RepID=UPI001CBD2B3D|nr:hypothetical protein [Alcanivorax limicola]MBZ2188838.1 hypothetical protein [Alcanivorax limicola]